MGFSGEINKNGITATINEAIKLVYEDGLTVTSNNISYNLPGIIDFAKEQSVADNKGAKDKKPFSIKFDAENSGITLNQERQLLADHIHFDNNDGSNSLILTYGEGKISTEIVGHEFSLSGDNLNDDFMDALFPGAEFRGGQMSVAVQGSFTDFSALIKIENTNLKNFRAMHNILALLDTIPALITFSLPEFDTQGLPITSAIIGFKYQDGYAPLESLTIDSPEFDLAGTGWLNFNEKTIDIDLNVITQAGANISQIPLAGFILAGDEKRPSITLKITGDLTDPKVTNSMFKEVTTMPFAILYRTLTLPVHLIKSMGNSKEGLGDE